MAYEQYGENEYWVAQTGSLSCNGAREATLEAMQYLGKWFKEKTGKMLVITAVTNGSHAGGEHSHAAGWKFDCIDWGGPEGLQSQFFGDDLNTNLAIEFAKYGAAAGLGMNAECPNSPNTHWDVSAWGQQWTGPFAVGNMGGWKGCAGNPTSSANNIVGQPGGSSTPQGRSSNSSGIETSGSIVKIKPSNNTFVEPLYPDLVSVPGNIPTSLVEQVIIDSNGGEEVGNAKSNPFKIMSGSGYQQMTGLDLGQFTSDQAQIDRQRTFDITKNINDRKVSSGGKPLNNNDRYQVDLKIEELEVHQPRVKKPEINLAPNASHSLASAILEVADHAEKRICKIENILATVMRYLFASASRMQINCVYYGGQDHRAKYKNIRCMRDDRINDGQIMQLDQCLSCTRYEPILGQTYDLLNEIGANTAAILDDCQSGYINLREYARLTRVERQQEPYEIRRFNVELNEVKDVTAIPFKDEWDGGVKMKWKTSPAETQRPSINWRQDINKPDNSPKKLSTYQFNPSNSAAQTGSGAKTMGCPFLPGKLESMMVIHYNSLKTSNENDIKTMYTEAYEYVTGSGGACNSAVSVCNTQGYSTLLKQICKENGDLDPLMLFSVFAAESGAEAGKNGGGIAQLKAFKDDKEIKTNFEKDLKGAVAAWKASYTKYNMNNNPMHATIFFHASNAGKACMELKGEKNAPQVFDQKFSQAMSSDFENAQDLKDLKIFWFKVVCFYEAFRQMDKQNGKMASGNASSDYDFLFQDADLNNVYFTSDYGGNNLSNVDGIDLTKDKKDTQS